MPMSNHHPSPVQVRRSCAFGGRMGDIVICLSLYRGVASLLVLVFVAANSGLIIALRMLDRSPTAFVSSNNRDGAYDTAGELRKTLEHDFGLVRPHQVCTKRFQIQNDSTIVWTLRSLKVGCACTVTHLSKAKISPGEGADLDIRYSAGAVPTDDKRAIGVCFNEPLAPEIRVEITAHVRPPATAEPQEAILPVVEPEANSTGYFSVMNFSEEVWGRSK